MEPFTLYLKRGPFSDGTSVYSVVMNKEMTVSDLIDYAISQNDEWGFISIIGDNGHFKPICRLEYRRGKIVSDTIPDETKGAKIKDIEASGGWSSMDYDIRIQ